MKPEKHVICPNRLRHVPRQFSWIDQRLVRDGHIRHADHSALALYLFLLTVADAKGLSYYSDRSISGYLRCPEGGVIAAREALIEAGLIAYQRPLYQVLSLPEASKAPRAIVRTGNARSVHVDEILPVLRIKKR